MTQVQTQVNLFRELMEREAPKDVDMSYSQSLIARWTDPLKTIKIDLVEGITNIKEYPKHVKIHSCEYWNVRLLEKHMYKPLIPQEILDKLVKAQELEVPFKWLIVQEQLFKAPEPIYHRTQGTKYVTVEKVHYYIPKVIYTSNFDPLLYALIPCGESIGIPYLIGAWKHA